MARLRGSQIYSPDIVQELKTAMAIQSPPGEDDEQTFRQKMNALQRFLNHGISRFSIDSWHHALTTLYHAYHPHHLQHDQDQGSHRPVLTKVKGLDDLRMLSRDVMLQREGGSLHEVDAQALRYLDNFLLALSCVREAKSCVGDLHRFLYRYYYDLGVDGSECSRLLSGQAISRASTLHSMARDGQILSPNAYEVSARQFGILTLDQMSGSTDHKLRRTVADMQLILQRWDRLMTGEGDIHLEDLDAESQQDLQLLSGTAAFEPVLRLMPDIFAKFYKCLELLKQWWVLAHEIYPELPINRPPMPPPSSSSPSSREGSLSRGDGSDSELSAVNKDSLDRFSDRILVPISKQLQQVKDSIQLKEDTLQSLGDELKLLDEREHHFENLAETYEKVTSELEEHMRQRKELVMIREKETFLPHNQISDVDVLQISRPSYHGAEDLNEQVSRVDRDIQMLQFQQTLLRQDYMVQLEVRPSLIRFKDDLRIRIAEAQNSLVEDKVERNRLLEIAKQGGETGTAKIKPVSSSGKDLSHGRKDTTLSSTAVVRSVSLSDPEPPNHDKENAPLPKPNANTSKGAERKMELSRLLNKPMRKYSSGSSMTAESATSLAVVEQKRRQSHPAARREETYKRSTVAVPTIKVHHSSVDRSAASGDKEPVKKSPRGSPLNGKLPHTQQKTSVPETQNRTETLFQKRLGKDVNETLTDKTGEQPGGKQLDVLVQRPRARPDPHTQETYAKSWKLKPKYEKVSSKVADNNSSNSPTNSDESIRENLTNKPIVHRSDSKTTSSDDVGKSTFTSLPISNSFDSKTSKVENMKTAKEATEHVSPASHTTKASERRKHSDVTLTKSPDNSKKSGDKSFPRSVSKHTNKNTPKTQQKDPQEKEERKRHNVEREPH